MLDTVDKHQIEAGVVDITPAYAKQLLDVNVNNRPLRRNYVRELADSIERGEWHLNGETLKFGENGQLLDGQHRLSAIVMANKTVRMIIVRNVRNDAFATIDLNRRRTSADVLAVAGYANATAIAAAVRLVLMCTTPPYFTRRQFSHVEVREWADAFHDDLQPYVKLGNMVARSNILSAPMVTGLAYLFGLKDRLNAQKFFARLSDGIGVAEGDPIYALRKRLSSNATQTAKLPQRDIAAMCIKAWNFSREGRETFVMVWSTDEGFPTVK